MAGYCVYVLQSQRNGRFYIGHSGALEERFEDHNAGRVTSTRHLRPWTIVYVQNCSNATEARKLEWKLKQAKSRKVIEALIATQLERPD